MAQNIKSPLIIKILVIMYQKIFIEYQPAFVPVFSEMAGNYQFNSSTYYIRGLFGRGHLPLSTLYVRLGDLEVEGKIRNLKVFRAGESTILDRVFIFDAPNCLGIMGLFVGLNEACLEGKLQPLPDLEFVHPAAHALLYSLGGFSGSSADCYLSADPNAVDLNQKVR